MTEAIITVILTQLATILEKQIRKEYKLVANAGKEINKLSNTFESIKAVLVDAEKKQVNQASVKLWFEKLKDVSFDTEDVLSEWITAMENVKAETFDKKKDKVRFVMIWLCLGYNKVVIRRDISLKVKEINERLDAIASEKDKYKFDEVIRNENSNHGVKTASYVDLSEVKGRESDKRNVVTKLLSNRNQELGLKLNVVSVRGMGGIGKTTLAQVVYESDEVIMNFEKKMWVCVSDPFDEVRVAKAIIEDIEGKVPDMFELETLLRCIRNYVKGKKFLLVLDDVWSHESTKSEQLLNSLSVGAPGSSILVTTRNEKVAKVMRSSYELCLGELSAHDSWSLFSKIAFHERSKRECKLLEAVGRKIAEKCKGLPLAIKTVGGLMQCKNSLPDWEKVLGSQFLELDEVQGVFPPLMLSYYDMPPAMKQCFSFCAFFTKGHIIEARNLIQLWMAQGFLSVSGNAADMEVMGRDYLQNLAMRSFFQDVKKDKDGKDILSVKMHDMVHEFARYLTKNECSIIEVNGDLKRKTELTHQSVRHLTLVRLEDGHFPISVPNVEKLRTFWVQSFYDSPPIVSHLDKIDPDLFHRLACIRALDLSRNRIGEIPNDIGKLNNLKYLNFSNNPFWELPLTLCDLHNLLTLKLSSCDHLRKLPPLIWKLANLKHLEIDRTDSLKTMPKGIGKLSSLHTLSKFIVLPGNDNQDATCGVQDLQNLNLLSGFIKIEGLGCIVDPDEAKKAELHKKNYISDLHMDFGPSSQTWSQDEVIQALEPSKNLQLLQISSYGGTKLSNWMMKLINLQKLSLLNCRNITELPPLGRLPSLATLKIEGLNNVKCIGLEFFGRPNMNGDRTNEPVAFPELKKLKISKMESWKHWIVRSDDREIADEGFTIMPRLKCLKISDCSNLKELPSLLLRSAPISKLRVHNCSLLRKDYQKSNGKKWSQISHISNSRIS